MNSLAKRLRQLKKMGYSTKISRIARDYQTCVTQNGVHRVEIRAFRNVITWLQQQIDDVKKDQRPGNDL